MTYDKIFVGGEWIEPSGTDMVDVINAATEQPVASVARANAGDVDQAVKAAAASLPASAAPAPPKREGKKA